MDTMIDFNTRFTYRHICITKVVISESTKK